MNWQINSLLQNAIDNIKRNNLVEAKVLLLKILDTEPSNFDALNIIGVITGKENNHIEAINFFRKAQKIRPDNNLVNFNLAKAFSESGNDLEAIKYYKIAIRLDKNHLGSWLNFGKSLCQLKRHDEALPNYDQAIKLKPDYEYLFGTLLLLKNSICHWRDFEANVKSLILKIKENKKCSLNFPVLIFSDSLLIQRKNCEVFINDKHPLNLSLGLISKYQRKNKIRIGYYSADFHNHATSYLMAELFERHDKTKFELIAFSFGPDEKDEMRHRISNAFNQFIDVRFKSDRDIALMSREMGIDIAVDLKGFTENARTDIFSHRAAPIQVNYIGYPGTMAAEYIDYIIADQMIIPTESRKYYYEKVVYLPNSYQVNDRKRIIADKAFTREELGLPKKGFVFCCFNNNFKITPHTFDGWIRILKAVEGSVLWLLEDNSTARINLLKEAKKRGLNPIRLVFAKRTKLPEHLARHCAADLFIDTLPYTAHTTTSDALWAGLPVLTCVGESFASRVAASLFNAIELPELIATTLEQ
jgi:predicted O-linked N-acetylglucosamine transferase (SPINDLY family)